MKGVPSFLPDIPLVLDIPVGCIAQCCLRPRRGADGPHTLLVGGRGVGASRASLSISQDFLFLCAI